MFLFSGREDRLKGANGLEISLREIFSRLPRWTIARAEPHRLPNIHWHQITTAESWFSSFSGIAFCLFGLLLKRGSDIRQFAQLFQ